ncbi:MAG: polymerase subunit alpha [Kosmotogales bacterium]|nr:polymerase subunit alpha [Kosmotogales bacterium]
MSDLKIAFIKTSDDLFESILTPNETLQFLIENDYTHCVILDNNLDSFIKWYKEFKLSKIKLFPGLEDKDFFYVARNSREFFQLLAHYNGLIEKPDIEIKIYKRNPDEEFGIFISRYLKKEDKEILDIYRFIGGKVPLKGNHFVLNDGNYDKYKNYFSEIIKQLPDEFIFKKYIHNFPVGESEDLREICERTLRNFQNVDFEKYLKRLNYELSVIKEKKFQDYFLIVSRIMELASKNGILIGPGRGSAVGSLVANCMNITSIDPLKYDLYFERFMNPSRNDYPDIDIDVEDEKRRDLLRILQNEYGKEKVILIQTKGKVSENKIEEGIKNYFRGINSNLNYKNYRGKGILRNLFYNRSVHAAGIILSRDNLKKMIPLREKDGFYISEWDMNSLEYCGLIKIDLLGLRNITTLKKFGLKRRDWDKIQNPNEVFRLFSEGMTAGIFQFESNEASVLSRKYKPKNINELSILMALNRPGPISTGVSAKSILNRRKKFSSIEYEDDQMFFQEDIIKYGIDNLMLNAYEAENLRKALSKKDLDLLNLATSRIVEESLFSRNMINKEIEYLKKFAAYSFNKSHSIAYSFISYWLEFFKYKYTRDFYDLFLSQSERKKRIRFLAEILSMNHNLSLSNLKSEIFIDPNKFNIKIDIDDNKIREKESDFYEWINENGKKLSNKNLEFLIKIGWFDDIKSRSQLINEINELSIGIDPELRNMTKIFGVKTVEGKKRVEDDGFAKAIMEYEVLGFNITRFEIEKDNIFETNSLEELIAKCGTGICFYESRVYNDKRYVSNGQIIFEVDYNVPEKGYIYIKDGKFSENSFFKVGKINRIIEIYKGFIEKENIRKTGKNICLRIFFDNYNLELKNSFIINDFPDEIVVEEKR